ncbi:MAG: ATP-binding protein [Gammaproteobacteria bacterium]
MRLSEVLPRISTSTAWQVRALIVVLGTLAAGANMSLEPQLTGGLSLSLVPAIVMIVTVLGGWEAAALSLAIIAVNALLLGHPGAWQVIAAAGIAVFCGEALRRGARPLLISLVQLLVALMSELPMLAGKLTIASLGTLSNAAAHAGINVALATLVLVFMPRRSNSFPARCRTRWDHIVFSLVVGTASVTILGLLTNTSHSHQPAAERWASAELMAARVSVLVALAVAASCALTKWCEATTRGLPERYRALHTKAALAGHRLKRGELPLEVAGFFLDVTRETNHLRRDAERYDKNLMEAQQAVAGMREELSQVKEALRHRSEQLKQAVGACERLNAHYRALMDCSADVNMFVDENGIIQSVNRAIERMLGHQPDALKGKPLGALIPPDCVVDHPLDLTGKDPANPVPHAVKGDVRAANGKNRHVAIHLHPLLARSERFYLVRLRDQRNTHEALATHPPLRESVRSAPESPSLFIAAMSHELRTPLHGLIATLDMLRIGGQPANEYQRQLSIARTSARALLKIANDVLDLARLGTGDFPLERKPFAMSTALREIADEARARATSLGLGVSTQMTSELPPTFLGDPARLKQILANLVSNALKFTEAGGVTLRVGYDGGLCTIDVQDTGEGVPHDKRDCIFEPFVQLDSGSGRKAGGSGLGLPICRRLAEAMGGRLVLLTSGPRGSTFRLTLPLESSQEPPPDEQSQRVFHNPHGRILVVEDNPANRYVAEALLTGLECPATIVAGGREALEMLQQQEFDLILMDCQMPGMDGYETTRQVRRLLKRRVPIIAMTANAMAADRNHCLEAGMDDFLAKPFGRSGLNAVLCKWLAPGAGGDAKHDPQARLAVLPDLDVKVLDELRDSLQWRMEPLKRICTTFTGSAQQTLALLDGSRGLDRQALQRHLHTLLGSAGMVGARQVEYLAGQIQRAVKANQREEIEGATAMLRLAVLRYEREFERRLNSGADARAEELGSEAFQGVA